MFSQKRPCEICWIIAAWRAATAGWWACSPTEPISLMRSVTAARPAIVVKESSAQCQWSVLPPNPRYLTSESAKSIP